MNRKEFVATVTDKNTTTNSASPLHTRMIRERTHQVPRPSGADWLAAFQGHSPLAFNIDEVVATFEHLFVPSLRLDTI